MKESTHWSVVTEWPIYDQVSGAHAQNLDMSHINLHPKFKLHNLLQEMNLGQSKWNMEKAIKFPVNVLVSLCTAHHCCRRSLFFCWGWNNKPFVETVELIECLGMPTCCFLTPAESPLVLHVHVFVVHCLTMTSPRFVFNEWLFCWKCFCASGAKHKGSGSFCGNMLNIYQLLLDAQGYSCSKSLIKMCHVLAVKHRKDMFFNFYTLLGDRSTTAPPAVSLPHYNAGLALFLQSLLSFLCRGFIFSLSLFAHDAMLLVTVDRWWKHDTNKTACSIKKAQLEKPKVMPE